VFLYDGPPFARRIAFGMLDLARDRLFLIAYTGLLRDFLA